MQMGASKTCAETRNMLHCARIRAVYLETAEVRKMAKRMEVGKLSVYIPQNKMEQKLVERLIKLGAKYDRSVNYIAVEAIVQYLEREEAKTE
jgi:Zn-finger nucleic acid-binding protein